MVEIMFTGWMFYFITCAIWTIFAMRMQFRHHPNASIKWNWICGVLNFIFCPICILIAVCLPKWWRKEKAEAIKADSE